MTDAPAPFAHLGPYSDWARQRLAALPALSSHDASPGADPAAVRTAVREVLQVPAEPERPTDVTVVNTWTRDGLRGEELEWSVGYGPITRARVVRPAGAAEPLPGVVALHGHDGFKYFGLDKISDGAGPPHPSVVELRRTHYQGRAFVDDLARRGFVVLAHDVFGWGSRRMPLAVMPADARRAAQTTGEAAPAADIGAAASTDTGSASTDTGSASVEEVAAYNAAAGVHEHLLAKYATVLGTSFAAIVAAEDRVAVSYLAGRDDVAGRLGCVGLSGGGCRAAMLTATDDRTDAAVVVGMMSRYAQLLDHNVASHTWMFFPPGLAAVADWPDLAGCHAPTPLLVQYDLDDDLFTKAGMRAADARLAATYHRVGAGDAYTGAFHPGPHKFDRAMQAEAFDWLSSALG